MKNYPYDTWHHANSGSQTFLKKRNKTLDYLRIKFVQSKIFESSKFNTLTFRRKSHQNRQDQMKWTYNLNQERTMNYTGWISWEDEFNNNFWRVNKFLFPILVHNPHKKTEKKTDLPQQSDWRQDIQDLHEMNL